MSALTDSTSIKIKGAAQFCVCLIIFIIGAYSAQQVQTIPGWLFLTVTVCGIGMMGFLQAMTGKSVPEMRTSNKRLQGIEKTIMLVKLISFAILFGLFYSGLYLVIAL